MSLILGLEWEGRYHKAKRYIPVLRVNDVNRSSYPKVTICIITAVVEQWSLPTQNQFENEENKAILKRLLFESAFKC